MTKSELIAVLSSRFAQLSLKDADVSVNLILGAITQTLAEGDRAEIRGFGSFQTHTRSARAGRNPKTGKPVAVPPKIVPHFRAGKEMLARVDKSVQGHYKPARLKTQSTKAG